MENKNPTNEIIELLIQNGIIYNSPKANAFALDVAKNLGTTNEFDNDLHVFPIRKLYNDLITQYVSNKSGLTYKPINIPANVEQMNINDFYEASDRVFLGSDSNFYVVNPNANIGANRILKYPISECDEKFVEKTKAINNALNIDPKAIEEKIKVKEKAEKKFLCNAGSALLNGVVFASAIGLELLCLNALPEIGPIAATSGPNLSADVSVIDSLKTFAPLVGSTLLFPGAMIYHGKKMIKNIASSLSNKEGIKSFINESELGDVNDGGTNSTDNNLAKDEIEDKDKNNSVNSYIQNNYGKSVAFLHKIYGYVPDPEKESAGFFKCCWEILKDSCKEIKNPDNYYSSGCNYSSREDAIIEIVNGIFGNNKELESNKALDGNKETESNKAADIIKFEPHNMDR